MVEVATVISRYVDSAWRNICWMYYGLSQSASRWHCGATQTRTSRNLYLATRGFSIHLSTNLYAYGSSSRICHVSLISCGSFGNWRRLCLASPLTLTVDLSLEPAQYVLYEGVLSGIPVGHIEVEQTHEFELPMTFVSCGRFEILADVHVYGAPDRSKLARGQLRATVEE